MNKDVKDGCKPARALRKKLTVEEEESNLQLIRLMHGHPMLWIKQKRKHSSFITRRKLWQAVASEMGKPVDAIVKQWNLLRDSYRRRLKNVQKNSLVGSKHPWYAFEAMQFLQETTIQPEQVQSLPKDNLLKDESIGSEKVGKSIDELAAKPPETSLTTSPKPKTQVKNALQKKRTFATSMRNPLPIKQKPQTQLSQGGTKENPVQKQNRDFLGGSTTVPPLKPLNPFVIAIGYELSKLSNESASIAQAEIWKIIEKCKLEDCCKMSSVGGIQFHENKYAAIKRNEPTPEYIEPEYLPGIVKMLEVVLECEEDA